MYFMFIFINEKSSTNANLPPGYGHERSLGVYPALCSNTPHNFATCLKHISQTKTNKTRQHIPSFVINRNMTHTQTKTAGITRNIQSNENPS